MAFGDLARDAVEMDTAWKRVLTEIAAAEHKLCASMTRREREYLQLVRQYAQANATAAAILAERQAVFSEAAKSAKRSTLTYARTKEVTNRYEEAVVQCQQLFEQLKHESL
jgi:hypothetical protein